MTHLLQTSLIPRYPMMAHRCAGVLGWTLGQVLSLIVRLDLWLTLFLPGTVKPAQHIGMQCHLNPSQSWKSLMHSCARRTLIGNLVPWRLKDPLGIRMWSRSKQYGLRYIFSIVYGNSLAFNAVCALNNGSGLYNVSVEKEECMNHVSKCIGMWLCNLKTSLSEDALTKGGKRWKNQYRQGRNALLMLISTSFRCTMPPIFANMTLLIPCAMLYVRHIVMPEAQKNCPPGATSWHWVKKAEACREEPAPHSTKKLYLSGVTNPARLKKIGAIFVELSSTSILQCCLRKCTQNPNESFQSKVKTVESLQQPLLQVQFWWNTTLSLWKDRCWPGWDISPMKSWSVWRRRMWRTKLQHLQRNAKDNLPMSHWCHTILAAFKLCVAFVWPSPSMSLSNCTRLSKVVPCDTTTLCGNYFCLWRKKGMQYQNWNNFFLNTAIPNSFIFML